MRRRFGMSMAVAALVVMAAAAGCDRGGGKVTKASAQSASKTSNESGASASADGDERYRTEVRPEKVEAGAQRQVDLAVVPASGLKVNREYPKWELSLTPPEALDLKKASFSADDFELTDSGARVSTRVSAAKPGTYEISGTAGFSVCNDETCHIMRDEKVSFRVHVSSNRDESGAE